MSDANDVKHLELRIVELEKRLEAQGARGTAAKLTPEELQTYQKVRDVLAADYGDFCGINDCYRCIVLRCGGGACVTRCIQRCIYECSCGPCNIGPLGQAGGGFGQLGG